MINKMFATVKRGLYVHRRCDTGRRGLTYSVSAKCESGAPRRGRTEGIDHRGPQRNTEEEAKDVELRMAIVSLSVRLCDLYGGIFPHLAEGLPAYIVRRIAPGGVVPVGRGPGEVHEVALRGLAAMRRCQADRGPRSAAGARTVLADDGEPRAPYPLSAPHEGDSSPRRTRRARRMEWDPEGGISLRDLRVLRGWQLGHLVAGKLAAKRDRITPERPEKMTR